MKRRYSIGGVSAVGLCLAATSVQAQTTNAQSSELEEIVVTGYRQSLQNAADAKRESINFTDSVFAEDIGKFPDTNIAESLNRIPGIQLTREVNGEGLNIAIRGLGTNFTKTLLNGHDISVASTGRTDAQSVNRELDLDLFPTELFNRLDVSKSSVASTVEGGVSGTVNLRSARPFDFETGWNVNYQVQGQYGEQSDKYSPRGAVTTTWRNDTFGVLVGVAAVRNKSTTKGYETIGWTNANLTYAQCGITPPSGTDANTGAGGSCTTGNETGGNGWVMPATLPGNVGNGLTPGAPVDQAFLLANNPGLTISQIGNANMPRLGREAYISGNRDRVSALTSVELRPSDSMRFSLDAMYADASRKFDRLDMDLVGRNFSTNGSLIPTHLQVDEHNIVTSGTFVNAQYFLEARPYDEEVDFYDITPTAQFDFSDSMQLTVSGFYSRSTFAREAPTILINTPLNQGLAVQFENQGGDFPNVTSNFDLNDPSIGWTWSGGRLNIQNEKRTTRTRGGNIDFQWGDNTNNLRSGVMYGEAYRLISPRDNSARWEDIACRGGLDANGNSPTTGRLPCDGLSAAAAVPQSALASYLMPGPAGFITVDFDRFKADTNYDELSSTAPEVNSAATGASAGSIEEKNRAAYFEANGEAKIMDRTLRLNAGIRYVKTNQTIGGPVTIGGVRQWQYLDSDYDAWLPSFNAALNVTDTVVARLAGSRTLTRANPNSMLPNTNFSDPSAQSASQGNPNLSPYLSTNVDLGVEWYTGQEGYVALALFGKQISGFTVPGTNTIQFRQLGVPFEDLTTQQQGAINTRGGPDSPNAVVTVSQQVNASGLLDLKGYEITWVQPLHFFEGLGFSANYTHVNQKSVGQGVPAIALGVSDYTYNGTLYFERDAASIRLSYTYLSDQTLTDPGQNGLTGIRFYGLGRGQLDLSASYEFASLPTSPRLSLDVTNLTGEPQRSVLGDTSPYSNATWTFYDPGYTVMLGLRGKF
ncbi:MAG TPA: TonB-dependent receptor [Steroidobacteraceae bacterium]|nr:TonB-dependent receptor [Steroidobacteraceae bacterium]